jgi:hypothetical protein
MTVTSGHLWAEKSHSQYVSPLSNGTTPSLHHVASMRLFDLSTTKSALFFYFLFVYILLEQAFGIWVIVVDKGYQGL